MKKLLPLILFVSIAHVSFATHLIGGNISYNRIGDRTIEVTITYYRDCLPESSGGGTPGALVADGPIYLSIYYDDSTFIKTVQISQSSLSIVNPFGTPLCVGEQPAQCVSKAEFKETIELPQSNSGYILLNQRCCFNTNIKNTDQSGTKGQTLFLKINDLSVANFSAKFRDDIGPVLCANYEQTIDLSATDLNKDSLTYELCDIKLGGSIQDPKPNLINFPIIPNLNFSNSYSIINPIDVSSPSDFNFNQETGLLTITPNMQGYYLLGVCSKEWRNNMVIQENFRYLVVRVANCKSAVNLQISEDKIIPYNCPLETWAQGADTYQWKIYPVTQTLIGLSNDSISNPSIIYRNSTEPRYGKFWLQVIGINNAGCTATDSIELTITDGSKFYLPNAFSPNGDGRNDYFGPQLSGYTLENIKIFNRWGNLIFESNTLDSKWDGTFQGQKVALDSYYWITILRDKHGNRISKKGSVIVVR